MTTTPNLGLTKDGDTELYSVERVNANSDRIDEFAGQTNTALAGKQDTLVFDQKPTASSTNPVTSGGVYAPVAELIDGGAKNRLPSVQRVGNNNTSASTTYTVSGATFTVNADGSITVSRESAGTAAATAWLYDATAALLADNFADGKHVMSIGYDGGSTTVRLRIKTGSGSSDYQYIDDSAVIQSSSYSGMNLSIMVAAAFSGTATIKPMICTKTAWDISEESVPYSPTNAELYAMIRALQAAQ